MQPVIEILLFLIAVPAVGTCFYLLVLTLLSAAPRLPPPSRRDTFFDVVVPAHNESGVIERTVASLKRIDWPEDKFRVLVVADNCTDNTATLARQAGAHVLERHNTELRGKGYALLLAMQASRDDGLATAMVVVDADAEVSTNLLEAFATRIERGAEALQAHYGILNPFASWRTRLITIAKAAFHIVRSRARERLGLSCGLRGNGWCVTHALLARVPYQAFSLTEDLEFGIDLGLAGVRVHYADEAHSDAEMVTNQVVAGNQRMRWEAGRFQLIRSRTWPLLRAGLTRPSAVCFELALDLLALPLSYVALNVLLLIGAAALATWWHAALLPWLWLGLACLAALLAHGLRGWQLSGIGWRGVLDLMRVPYFLVWKVLLVLKKKAPAGWVRTEREKS
jgi:cellulose synthase/poly-beta-1,6-N-acetylglucosamine synthase-like glycosyltransferase